MNQSLVSFITNSILTHLLWSVADDILVQDAHQCMSVQSKPVFYDLFLFACLIIESICIIVKA